MRYVFVALSLACGLSAARGEQAFDATLAGHALLPAATFIAPPIDAPWDSQQSGRFTGPDNKRVEDYGSIPGTTSAANGSRPTGLDLPFNGQPIQGFSSIRPVPGDPGVYWVLSDNGFGTKRNSADALLMVHQMQVDFRAGLVTRERTIFLADPNRQVPFPIVNEAESARYLTGGDFDPESLQPVADGFWMGDEFGPYLVKFDAEGRVQKVLPTRLGSEELRGPDHPTLRGATPRVQRSGGFEGMTMTPDGSRIYALLEKPLLGADGKPDGNGLQLLELDTAKAAWTGRALRYRLAPGAVSIGDITLIDDRRALVIERDDGEGDPSLGCGPDQKPPACFPNPARLKRIYLADLGATDADGFVRKLGYIDLLAIQDPDRQARQRGDLGPDAPADRFGFPFFTIESVAMVDAEHIIVGNDNNLPFSAGRHLTKADDNEFILLRVPELLQAK